jgi:hypothetical protein
MALLTAVGDTLERRLAMEAALTRGLPDDDSPRKAWGGQPGVVVLSFVEDCGFGARRKGVGDATCSGDKARLSSNHDHRLLSETLGNEVSVPVLPR